MALCECGKRDDFEVIDDFRVPASARLEAARRLAVSFVPDKDAVCEIDLHTHSFYSDGYRSPAARVFEAFRRRMRAIAIADHDVFDGQCEAIQAGKIFSIDVVPAIEFYTDRPGVEVIGHFPEVGAFLAMLDSGVATETIEAIRAAKAKQLGRMIERVPEAFSRLGMRAEITFEDIDTFLRNGISTKGDISVVMWQKYGPELVERRIAFDVKEFPATYTPKDQWLNVPPELALALSPVASVRRIVSWGGLPGLPHPTELRAKEGLANAALVAVIEELAAAGLQTIEVDGFRNGICPETGLQQTDLFDSMRKEFNRSHPERFPLLFTNGSDDHDQPNEGLEMGCGKNRNLRPAFGQYENLLQLRERSEAIWQ